MHSITAVTIHHQHAEQIVSISTHTMNTSHDLGFLFCIPYYIGVSRGLSYQSGRSRSSNECIQDR